MFESILIDLAKNYSGKTVDLIIGYGSLIIPFEPNYRYKPRRAG